MRCRKCGEKAVINMRQHRLSLCKEHFLEWLPIQIERFIKKYRMFTKGDRVLVAVSGGKDSLTLWDILWKLGYQTQGLYIHLGIDESIGYSENSLTACRQFADNPAADHRVSIRWRGCPRRLSVQFPIALWRHG